MNGQIVVCPGWNDGDQLRRTLRDLTEMQFSSCSLVPVGITKYRQGLAKLRPVDAATAAEIIDIADEYGRENLERFGTRRFFCADELYLRAGRPLPQAEYYEGYRQLENGVGLMRSLEDDFLAGLATVDVPARFSPFTIATGTAAAPFLRGLVQRAMGTIPACGARSSPWKTTSSATPSTWRACLPGRISPPSCGDGTWGPGADPHPHDAPRRDRVSG